ncbi:MAG: class I SAM-dependent methyltransferase [Omnitrophica WOR_2 bacterium]
MAGNRHGLVKGWKYVLSDLSTEMVIRSRRNLSQFEDSFSYGVWNAGAIPFMENKFDGVIGLGLLDETLQPEPILDEIRRVMKTGGKFYATAGGMHHLQELESIAREVLPEADFGGHPERFGLENGKRILSRRFCNIHRYRFPDKLVFDQVTPILRYILSEAAVRDQMTPEKTRHLTHLIEELLGKQRSISITSDKGIFQAEKGCA